MRLNSCAFTELGHVSSGLGLFMFWRLSLAVSLLPVLICAGSAQALNMTSGLLGLNATHAEDQSLWLINGANRSPLETASGSLSKLDLKAPGKARREYEKGYQLLLKKDFQGAIGHLTIATSIYPSFVAAHDSLGSAYLGLHQDERARDEFARAAELDDHLPTPLFNLGCADLALNQYPAAEQSFQKASALAPLDLTVLTALAYGEYLNRDFAGVVNTAAKVHERKHDGAALVHFYAAAALEAEREFPQAQNQLDTLLKEDPKSPAAAQAHLMMVQLEQEAKLPPPSPLPDGGLKAPIVTVDAAEPTGPVQLPENFRRLMQEAKENSQLEEAEATQPCAGCVAAVPSAAAAPEPSMTDAIRSPVARGDGGLLFHASTDEVALFFAVTDHGRPVTNLTNKDLHILDDERPPVAITSLRNESELPLRLGLLIDTSDSISTRFKFEQQVASDFLENVVTGQDDLGFVIGFSNTILLVQDFTGDRKRIANAVGELVPAGGTALWDAVDFATGKLAAGVESKPVSRVLVVISDGEDNSSSVTAKQAIDHALRGGISVYTVSTRELLDETVSSIVGEHALDTLAELTGGAAFSPGSVHRLKGSLNDLQQLIRSRYLVSYKPADFTRDGHYRTIEIEAQKDNHKLRVYARKGYSAGSASESAHF